MLEVLLFLVLSVHNLDYPDNIFSYDEPSKHEIIQDLLEYDKQDSFYSIYNKLPPIRQTDLSAPKEIITAQSAVVVDIMSGKVLWQREPDAPASIASLTKLMTALVFLDTNPDFNQEIEIIPEDSQNIEGSRLYMSAGEKLTVGDLFYVSLIGSANNSTKALARSTGLSSDDFLGKMNSKAQQMGLLSTIFHDVTGLDPNNKSSALDYSRLAAYAFRNSMIRDALNRTEYVFKTIDKEIRHRITNTNKLLNDNELSLVGAKTGYLDEAKYTFVSQFEIGDHQVIITLLGSLTSSARFSETKSLINWVSDNYLWLI